MIENISSSFFPWRAEWRSGFHGIDRLKRSRGVSVAVLLALAAGPSAASGQVSDTDTVTVRLRAVTPQLEAYAQVEPISLLRISAAESGVITGLRIVPGMRVAPGQVLAHLGGPALEAARSQSESEVRSAAAQLSAAQRSLAIEQLQLLSHLTTQSAVIQAEGTEAQAQSLLDSAQSRLRAIRQMMTLTAPAGGVVLALSAANGELASAGQVIATLQPDHRLWLRATYYGTDLSKIRAGTVGAFSSTEGSDPIAVKVVSVYAAIAAGGGESISLLPEKRSAPLPALINGEAGTVTLKLPPRMLAAIPTRALILDRGSWWVMIHTPQGDRPQAVIPGPAEGWDTFIEQGVEPGAKIIVNNAYLLFHAGISQQYQPPD